MNIPATTIQEQLSILKNRNVRLDENSAGILLQYGYYNLINGYKDAFIDKKRSNLRHYILRTSANHQIPITCRDFRQVGAR